MSELLDWKKVSDKLPEDGDKCLLYGESGLMQGPIQWSGKNKMWMDLFGPLASAEAGMCIKPDTKGLTHWAVVNEPDDTEPPEGTP